MFKLQLLKKPNKHSGDNLTRGKTFKVGGFHITNVSGPANGWLDRWHRKPDKKKKKSKVIKASKVRARKKK